MRCRGVIFGLALVGLSVRAAVAQPPATVDPFVARPIDAIPRASDSIGTLQPTAAYPATGLPTVLASSPAYSSIAPATSGVAPVSYLEGEQQEPAPPAACPPTMNCDDCPCCHCAPCECPQTPAPCQPCPHISTISPYWNLNIFGALQANMYFSTARPVAPGLPLFLAPGAAEPENTVDVFARPSNIGAVFTGPEVGGFRAGGMMWGLFYNDALIVDRYGFLPFQAWGDIKNEDWRIAAGLQFNIFNPLAPNMLAFSMLFGCGDAGNNFPGQFRIERYLHPSEDSQWTLQFGLSDPVATSVITNTGIASIITGAPPLRITEDNGWPNLEGRIAYGLGEEKLVGLQPKRTLEFGGSVVGGQLRSALALAPNVVANTFGIGADFCWRITDRWGVQGEAYTGQALGFLNAGVMQSVNTLSFAAIRTRGGWGEVYYYITPCFHTHWGAGIDDPIDRDLALGQIERNQTAFANLIWDITKQFRVGVELSWHRTDYVALTDNDGAGIQTQMQWSF